MVTLAPDKAADASVKANAGVNSEHARLAIELRSWRASPARAPRGAAPVALGLPCSKLLVVIAICTVAAITLPAVKGIGRTAAIYNAATRHDFG
ncbi:MAG: hypothetical protein RMH97_06355 [Verrucomicrobiales bacterium]|nr:hypothetical protein [Verrucomicrobiales bacterium]